MPKSCMEMVCDFFCGTHHKPDVVKNPDLRETIYERESIPEVDTVKRDMDQMRNFYRNRNID